MALFFSWGGCLQEYEAEIASLTSLSGRVMALNNAQVFSGKQKDNPSIFNMHRIFNFKNHVAI